MRGKVIEIIEKSPVKCPKCGEVIAWRTESEVDVIESEPYLNLLRKASKRCKLDETQHVLFNSVTLNEEEARELVKIAKNGLLAKPSAELVEQLVARALFYGRAIGMQRNWSDNC
nr:MAG TPA: DNA-directed RNA polymerase II subunit [Caudoviricetes sp.]